MLLSNVRPNVSDYDIDYAIPIGQSFPLKIAMFNHFHFNFTIDNLYHQTSFAIVSFTVLLSTYTIYKLNLTSCTNLQVKPTNFEMATVDNRVTISTPDSVFPIRGCLKIQDALVSNYGPQNKK